jgi:hypothetical protein
MEPKMVVREERVMGRICRLKVRLLACGEGGGLADGEKGSRAW